MTSTKIDATLRIWKNGGVVDCALKTSGIFRRTDAENLLPREDIFGVDTESLTKGGTPEKEYRDGELKTLLVPVHFHNGGHVLETPSGEGMLSAFFALLYRRGMFSWEKSPSRYAQRIKRKNRPTARDGRRVTLKPWVSVWFNMPYDFGRLVADSMPTLKSVASGSDSYRVRISPRFELEVVRMHFGSSSSFEWIIRETQAQAIMRLLGLDLVGYWKCSLAKAAESVGATAKVDIEEQIDDVYRKPFETFTKNEWSLFRKYAASDAKTHLELYHETASLLTAIDARVVRKNGLIPPSAPGASARIVFAGAFDAHPDLDAWERYPVGFDQFGCDAYFGGRAFCVKPGVHRNMRILDLKSAYPFQYALLPDPVTVRMRKAQPGAFVVDAWRGKYGVLVVSGEATDDVYPAFRVHDPKQHGRLHYVFGPFERRSVTIPELVIGVLRGSLRVDRVHGGFWMQGSPETSFLRAGIEKFFRVKENPDNSKALQNLAKLLANSCYGKLIEVKCHDYLVAENLPIPNFLAKREIAKSIADIYASGGPCPSEIPLYFGSDATKALECAEDYREGVMSLPLEQRHANPLVVAHYIQALTFAKEPSAGDVVSVQTYLQDVKEYTCGQYFMAAYASQVTGATSAMLGLMAACTGALQGDTDSVHIPMPDAAARVEDLPGYARYFDVMREAGYLSPRRITRGGEVHYEGGIPSLPNLGAWEEETKGATFESILVRPKVYSHDIGPETPAFLEKRAGNPNLIWERYKQAKHGFSKFHSPAIEKLLREKGIALPERAKNARRRRALDLHEAMRILLREKTYFYTQKEAPRKLRESVRSGLPVGVFISREMDLTLKPDPNTWTDESGTVRWKPLPLTPPHEKEPGV